MKPSDIVQTVEPIGDHTEYQHQIEQAARRALFETDPGTILHQQQHLSGTHPAFAALDIVYLTDIRVFNSPSSSVFVLDLIDHPPIFAVLTDDMLQREHLTGLLIPDEKNRAGRTEPKAFNNVITFQRRGFNVPQGHTSLSFTKEILEKAGIVCLPCTAFGSAGEGFVRFSLTAPDARIAEATERLAALK